MNSQFTINDGLLRRYGQTLSFIQKHLPTERRVLDLGVSNPFSVILREKGYEVFNTYREDLDIQPEAIREYDNIEFANALEICEHLINPMAVLSQLPCEKTVTSIHLSLWFAKAYRSKTDPWDQHFHEFEDWQFDWLLEKAGWKVIDSEKWTSPVGKLGIRPLL